MDREPDWSWWDETRAVARRQARGAGQASDAADDLAQDLAVAALERGAGAARPGAWLERVGRNARIDRWRVERRRRELVADVERPSAPPDPEAGALARERRGVLRRALAALPRPLRRATLARFHADLSFDAVAARLGTREGTARTRVHRALARLRDGLGGLRAVVAPIFPGWAGAQATVLGLTLVAGVARPALFPAAAPGAPVTRSHAAPRERVLAAAPVAVAPPAPTRAAPTSPAPARAFVSRTTKAQAPAPAAPPAVQRMDFENDDIEVGVLRPDGIVLTSQAPSTHDSLIELRRHFLPELAKSFEDL